MKHYEYEINLLVEGELPETDKIEVFEHLAACEECRTLFTQYLELKEKSAAYCGNYIAAAKSERTSRPMVKRNNVYRWAFYVSSAAALLLAFVLLNRTPDNHYITKNEVRVDTVFVPKEKQIIKYVSSVANPAAKTPQHQSFLQFVNNLRVEKITDTDKI